MGLTGVLSLIVDGCYNGFCDWDENRHSSPPCGEDFLCFKTNRSIQARHFFQAIPVRNWYFIYFGVSLNGGVFPPFHTPSADPFLFRKRTHGPVGETHHFRKPPNINISTNNSWIGIMKVKIAESKTRSLWLLPTRVGCRRPRPQ